MRESFIFEGEKNSQRDKPFPLTKWKLYNTTTPGKFMIFYRDWYKQNHSLYIKVKEMILLQSILNN